MDFSSLLSNFDPFRPQQQAQPVPSALMPTSTPQSMDDSPIMKGPTPERAPGLYGLLPEKLQHGAFRDFMGALGDALLVGSGHDPIYRTYKESQKLSEALAGYNPDDPKSITAVLQQLAKSGSTQAPQLGLNLLNHASDLAIRKQIQEQNNQYRQDQIDVRKDSALARMTPYIGGMLAGVKDLPGYQSAYQRAEAIAQRIGPQYHAADFGLVDPQDWTPEATSTVGMTRNNTQVSADKAAQRTTSERNTDVNAQSRVESAQIGAGSRVRSAGISAAKPTNATMLQALINKQNNGGKLTPSEQAAFDKLTHTGGTGTKRALPPGLVAGSGQNKPTPTPKDIQYLKANPQLRAQFDAHFGPGASAKILGK